MNHCHCLVLIGATDCAAAAAQPGAAAQARIDRLITAAGQRCDIRFIRNGKACLCAQAADFMRGKLSWRVEKVGTAQDLVDQVGTISTRSSDFLQVRLTDGRTLPSADFPRLELPRIAEH
jgi:hypothetical protein